MKQGWANALAFLPVIPWAITTSIYFNKITEAYVADQENVVSSLANWYVLVTSLITAGFAIVTALIGLWKLKNDNKTIKEAYPTASAGFTYMLALLALVTILLRFLLGSL